MKLKLIMIMIQYLLCHSTVGLLLNLMETLLLLYIIILLLTIQHKAVVVAVAARHTCAVLDALGALSELEGREGLGRACLVAANCGTHVVVCALPTRSPTHASTYVLTHSFTYQHPHPHSPPPSHPTHTSLPSPTIPIIHHHIPTTPHHPLL